MVEKTMQKRARKNTLAITSATHGIPTIAQATFAPATFAPKKRHLLRRKLLRDNCSGDNCSGDNCSDDNCSGNNCSSDICTGDNFSGSGDNYPGDNCSDLVLGSPYYHEHCQDGRGAAVHLFEWKWSDIAAECEHFLGPKGYCAVQTSPPNENRVVTNPNRPWWERFQPVSYKLVTRSGNEDDFRDMVFRCNKVGVRIYIDAVINHMTGVGVTGQGTDGSHYDGNTLSYPVVPFSELDFHGNDTCHTGSMNIENYGDANQVRNCRLLRLSDLNGGKDYVREKIARYLNHLIDLGVAGFRIDATKHMWPGDLSAILGKVNDVHAGGRPFVFQEVIDYGEGEAVSQYEYLGTGRVTSFSYGQYVAQAFQGLFPLKNLKTLGSTWDNMVGAFEAVVFLDNHDNQRGHGGAGSVLTNSDSRLYKLGNAFMLAYTYGFPKVMSSYSFHGPEDGPPHHSNMSIRSPSINSDDSCGNGWVCEHRWRQIYNMVVFRKVTYGKNVNNWWDNGGRQIAFSRGDKGFLVINLEGFDLNQSLMTGLPGGTYCDVISGNLVGGMCTGTTIMVGDDRRAHFSISHRSEDPMVAIHAGVYRYTPPVDRWKSTLKECSHIQAYSSFNETKGASDDCSVSPDQPIKCSVQ